MGNQNKTDETTDRGRKEYFPPKIVHTEPIEARAVTCAMADFSCNPGPIQS